MLLVGRLGVGVHPVAQLDKVGSDSVDGRDHSGLGVTHRQAPRRTAQMWGQVRV